MKKLITLSVVTLTLMQSVGSSWASGPGTTAADILNIPVGARAIGMGESYVAQADDLSSLYWNPAGLALMQERQASFSYNQLVKDLSYQNAGIGIPLENGALGASISYLSYGNIPGYDTSGQSIGDQTAYSGVGTFGASWLGSQWSAGANIKGIQEKLSDVSATGVAFDVGGNLIYPKPVFGGTMRLGAVVQNMGSGMKLLQQNDPFPTDWKVGLAAVQMLDRRLNLSLDYGKPNFDTGVVSAGAEYWVAKFLALRTGYTNNHLEGSGIRAGVGLRIKGISFDYAYAGEGELGMANRFELAFRFGEPRPILTPEERKILNQAKAAMRNDRYEQATLLFDSLIELEPHYRPARRYMKVAMAKLEGQQSQMLARQGTIYDPNAASANHKPALPEMDDLEQLLNMTTPKAAQAPKGGSPKAATSPSDSEQGVK